MEQLLTAFDINVKQLLFNLLNFAVLYAVLYTLGYKPILKFVRERTAKIEKGVADADAAQQALAEAQVEQDKVLTAARKEAQDIIHGAKEQAQVQADALLEKKTAELADIAQRAKQQIHEERERVLREAEAQAVDLVMVATEKLLMEKLDDTTDAAYVKRIVAGAR